MKTLIAVPCMDFVPIGFAFSLANMTYEGDCKLQMQSGSLVYESRNIIAKKAVTDAVDYVLWLDSDVVFPKDLLPRMIKHMEDKEIVTGLYFRRAMPFSPVIFKSYEEYDHAIKWEDYLDYPRDSVFEVAGCGFGCVMMKAELFFDVALNYQAFFDPYKGCGEDLSMCYRLKELGHKIYCDSSIKLGHIGHITCDESLWSSRNEG